MTGPAWIPGARPWRIASINLDDNEQLLGIVAVVQPPVIDRIRELIGDGNPIEVVRAGAEFDLTTLLWIELNLPQIRRLWYSLDGISVQDPRHIPGMYESISRLAAMIEES